MRDSSWSSPPRSLSVLLVHLLQQVELLPLHAARQVLVVDVLDDVLGVGPRVVDVRALVDAGQEAVAPQLRADDRLARAEHHVAGQVLVLRAQAVGEPGAHAGPRRLRFAGVHHQQRRLVVGRVGVHRADDANVVDARGRRSGYSSLTSMPLWPCLSNLNGDGNRPPPLARSVESCASGRVPLYFSRARLGVEGVHLRGAAVHEQEDDALGRRLEHRRPGGERIVGRLRLGSQQAFAGQHGGQAQRAEAAADPAEHVTTGDAKVRWDEHDGGPQVCGERGIRSPGLAVSPS